MFYMKYLQWFNTTDIAPTTDVYIHELLRNDVKSYSLTNSRVRGIILFYYNEYDYNNFTKIV